MAIEIVEDEAAPKEPTFPRLGKGGELLCFFTDETGGITLESGEGYSAGDRFSNRRYRPFTGSIRNAD